MAPIVLTIAFLLAPQFWAVLRGKDALTRVGFLMLSTALVLTCVAVILFYPDTSGHDDEGADRDTYEVRFHFARLGLLIAANLAFLALIAATRRWAGPLPRSVNWLATALALSVTAHLIVILWLNAVLLPALGSNLTMMRLLNATFLIPLLAITVICVMMLLRCGLGHAPRP